VRPLRGRLVPAAPSLVLRLRRVLSPWSVMGMRLRRCLAAARPSGACGTVLGLRLRRVLGPWSVVLGRSSEALTLFFMSCSCAALGWRAGHCKLDQGPRTKDCAAGAMTRQSRSSSMVLPLRGRPWSVVRMRLRRCLAAARPSLVRRPWSIMGKCVRSSRDPRLMGAKHTASSTKDQGPRTKDQGPRTKDQGLKD
jgi:hypothetical protein